MLLLRVEFWQFLEKKEKYNYPVNAEGAGTKI